MHGLGIRGAVCLNVYSVRKAGWMFFCFVLFFVFLHGRSSGLLIAYLTVLVDTLPDHLFFCLWFGLQAGVYGCWLKLERFQ